MISYARRWCLQPTRLSYVVATGILIMWGIYLAPSMAVAQLSDPIPDSIRFTIGIEPLTQLPDSRNAMIPDQTPNARARLNVFRQAPDGRRFINDLRGLLYMFDDRFQSSLYLDLKRFYPNMVFIGGRSAGFMSFTFHPDFLSNGNFYTLHTEQPTATSPVPHFTAPTANPVHFHTVLTEWQATTPTASEFNGTRRELLRVGMTTPRYFHPFGDLSFNPTTSPGDPDYGLLYISGGDWGVINGQNRPEPDQLQRLDTLVGTILRIDPSGTGGIGSYGIPPGNPFATDAEPATLGEIWAYGFRNAHRMAWDPTGQLFITDIGQNHIESIDLIHPGHNYGWPKREGTFINGLEVNDNFTQVFSLPPEVLDGTQEDGFTYPVAQFDHDEGRAIAGGFFYQSNRIPQLRNHFVFGDIVSGRLFYTSHAELMAADDGIPGTTARIRELQLVQDGTVITLLDLVRDEVGDTNRADLRFGTDTTGELYIITKTDGIIRRLIPLP